MAGLLMFCSLNDVALLNAFDKDALLLLFTTNSIHSVRCIVFYRTVLITSTGVPN